MTSRAALLACVVATGCGSSGPARIAYVGTQTIAGESQQPSSSTATCPASVTIRVVDAGQSPVPGAQVTVHQRISMRAPSTVPLVTTYRTAPVTADINGVAVVCHPDQVPPKSEAMFEHRDGGHIEAELGERTAKLSPPFTAPLVLP